MLLAAFPGAIVDQFIYLHRTHDEKHNSDGGGGILTTGSKDTRGSKNHGRNHAANKQYCTKGLVCGSYLPYQ